FMEYFSGSSRKSSKHSSSTRKAPICRHRFASLFSYSGSAATPVGLFGLQKNTIYISCRMASKNSSPQQNPYSSERKQYSFWQPHAFKSCSYSAKVGAGTIAFLGFTANTRPKFRSAAPFPQIMDSIGTPSAFSRARRSSSHSPSG